MTSRSSSNRCLLALLSLSFSGSRIPRRCSRARRATRRAFCNAHLKTPPSFPRLQRWANRPSGISIVTMTSSVRCLICDNSLPRRAWQRHECTYLAHSFANTDGKINGRNGEVIKPLTAAWLRGGFSMASTFLKATMKIL